MSFAPSQSVETRTSWAVATVALVVLGMSFGAAWINTVALKDIASEVGGARSVPAFAGALAWLGSGTGGILMSRRGRADRHALDRDLRLADDRARAFDLDLGPPWPLWIGQGLFIGFIGIGGINAPLYIYVSRWFDRRRGSALALISSGTYVAGAIWPPIFEQAIVNYGWRQTMFWYAIAEIVVVAPLAAIYFHHAARGDCAGGGRRRASARKRVSSAGRRMPCSR